MEPIIIKRGKKEYAFLSDKLVVTKKDKVIGEIKYEEVGKIIYNPKFGIVDLVGIFAPGGGIYYFPKAFVIRVKSKNDLEDALWIRLSKKEFEKVKDIFGAPVDII